MAPEYAMEGLFSIKSNVYSFGILMLEIVSGKKNSAFFQPECAQSSIICMYFFIICILCSN